MPKSFALSYQLAASVLCVCLLGCTQLSPLTPLTPLTPPSPPPASTSTPASNPKGYTIAEIMVNDPVAYREYVAAVTPLIAKHSGVYLVRAGKVATKEGAAAQGRIVVIEFPSFAAAQAFYDCVEYQAIIGLRTKSATSRVLQVEGTARQQRKYRVVAAMMKAY